MALTNKLSAIGDAIREKTGKTELLTLDAMPGEIASIETGGGGSIEVEPMVLTGNCQYSCSGVVANKYIELFGDTLSTKDITDSGYMFKSYQGKNIPFELNYNPTSSSHSINQTFQNAGNLITLPKMNNVKPGTMSNIFAYCSRLREIPEDYFKDWDWSYHQNPNTGSYSAGHGSLFQYCFSLRKMPLNFLKNVHPKPHYSNSYFYSSFYQCCALDELIGLPIPYISPGWTSNSFNTTFNYCYRLKDIIFETNEDGTPKVVEWKNQTIDLLIDCSTSNVKNNILYGNSGITADKEVKDDATYQALKNDPDWFTVKNQYHRYNKTSAINTINSLPDTSAYLATAGGTNTIKFKGTAGALTDGGAINTLTEEEIAVATAKGWTVSMV